MALTKPAARPGNPCFSSGPCAKIPGWSPHLLNNAFVGRSHRAREGKARLGEVINLMRAVLEVPQDHVIAIVPASDTGAVEMALWNLLGARGVDVLAWESFGRTWVGDVTSQLKLDNARIIEADYGLLPDLASVDFGRDVVFTWNGTTSGVRVPDGAWIPDEREGLTICDATSAAFAQALDYSKLDVVTFSWQKVLGGEAAHGVIILSPRALARLESYTPPWPLPKIFRLTKAGKPIDGLFRGETINTPSMLCVADCLAALYWARDIGGLPALIARADNNARTIAGWVEQTGWIEHLAVSPETRSNTSVCLRLSADASARLPADACKWMAGLLEREGVAYDIASYRDAPAGLRIWCGATVEQHDIELLLPWLDWAFSEI